MKTTAHTPWRIAMLLFVVAALSPTSRAEIPGSAGIQFFQGTLKEARAKAKAENKAVFLDAYASWCGPCKTMDQEVYTDPKVGEYFRQHFIAIKVDMEKGEGPELAKKLPSIDGYPSLLFFGPDGFLTKTILGSRSADDFLAEARLVAR
jgi:thiol:disulfide interchange protein